MRVVFYIGYVFMKNITRQYVQIYREREILRDFFYSKIKSPRNQIIFQIQYLFIYI